MTNERVTLNQVLAAVFDSNETKIDTHIVSGTGLIATQKFHIIGTVEDTEFGVDEAITMAECVLEVVTSKSQLPIVLLVDVVGQKLAKRDEWLGMYAYFAHLLQCLELARSQGNKLISLIYNQAIGGSFIAFGLMADRIYALSHAQLAVMWLEGMAKVTTIDIKTLQDISKTSPVFAPGVDNFKKLGGLHEVLDLQAVKKQLLSVLNEACSEDNRAQLGASYGGRTKAYDIIKKLQQL